MDIHSMHKIEAYAWKHKKTCTFSKDHYDDGVWRGTVTGVKGTVSCAVFRTGMEPRSGAADGTCAAYWAGAAVFVSDGGDGGAGLTAIDATGAESAITGTTGAAETTLLGAITGAGVENVLGTPAAGPVAGRTVLGTSAGIVLCDAVLGT